MWPTCTSRPREDARLDSSCGRKRSISTRLGRARMAAKITALRIAADFIRLFFMTLSSNTLFAGVARRSSLINATKNKKKGQTKPGKPKGDKPKGRPIAGGPDGTHALGFRHDSLRNRQRVRVDQLSSRNQGGFDGLGLGELKLLVPNLPQPLLHQAEHHKPPDHAEDDQVQVEG